ncbi:uncharacterized protein Dwil_GK16338 [Drosophila willistoni]|uniref:Invertebrate defensins family profile domain-containing protein n=1 Tax=Drosophila willistoni TaxID=7260 RepID=A0A0Q9X061_DROWI|nr:uncharacterized protein LOC6644869 [Drosophila willistoni]KRF98840.1 uncharacterized protein Dwil_GK16338 [Drosophila willistoni]
MKRLINQTLFCFILMLILGLSQAKSVGQHRREANAAPEPAPVPAPVPTPEAAAPLGQSSDLDTFHSGESNEDETEATTLGIVSIKSRVIAKDRALCQQLSRYHPHYPKCHDYCKRLDHWIGQCWNESCHCVS